MRKKKLYLSQVPLNKGGPLAMFIPALMGDVVHMAITKFDLPGQLAELPLIDIFSSFFIEHDTPIRPMSSKPEELVKLINMQSHIHLTVDEVDMMGIDIGNQSVTWLTPKGRVYGLTGQPAVRYRNVTYAPITEYKIKEREFAVPVEKRYAQYRSLMNALAILKAYVPSTPQETLT